MIIPDDPKLRNEHLLWVLNTCTASRKSRKEMYDRRRQFFLYGTGSDEEIKYNRLESHMDLVASFLYSPDRAEFELSAPANADDAQVGDHHPERLADQRDEHDDIDGEREPEHRVAAEADGGVAAGCLRRG